MSQLNRLTFNIIQINIKSRPVRTAAVCGSFQVTGSLSRRSMVTLAPKCAQPVESAKGAENCRKSMAIWVFHPVEIKLVEATVLPIAAARRSSMRPRARIGNRYNRRIQKTTRYTAVVKELELWSMLIRFFISFRCSMSFWQGKRDKTSSVAASSSIRSTCLSFLARWQFREIHWNLLNPLKSTEIYWNLSKSHKLAFSMMPSPFWQGQRSSKESQAADGTTRQRFPALQDKRNCSTKLQEIYSIFYTDLYCRWCLNIIDYFHR